MWREIAREFDARLSSLWGQPLSLCPGRKYAHSLCEIGESLEGGISSEVPEADVAGVMKDLVTIADAQLQCFPKNIFWDFDGFVSVLLEKDSLEKRRACVDQVQLLYERFSTGQMRFQYAHDLIYGFDWARWVQKDPDSRSEIGPFDQVFLERMEHRHKELLEEVHKHRSIKYPYEAELEKSKGFRNPFDFSRNFKEEEALMNALALQNFIPVSFWNRPFDAVWDKPFEAKRKELAKELSV